VARLPLLQKLDEYEAFERVLFEAHVRHPIRIPAYCLMPSHWYRPLYPREGEEKSCVPLFAGD
jgi:putative transposase